MRFPPAGPTLVWMLFALASTLVSAAFSVFVLSGYRRRGHRHQLIWGIGLALFAIASAAGLAARTGDATELGYRLFYVFGAILNVGWLAHGTATLLAPRRAADLTLAGLIAFSFVSAFAVFASPVDLTAATDTGRGFQASVVPRLLAGIGSGLGTIVLAGGALWSGWTFLRRGRNGRRALANLIIAIGVLVTAAGGTAAFTGASGIVEVTNLVGVSIMFLGFLLV